MYTSSYTLMYMSRLLRPLQGEADATQAALGQATQRLAPQAIDVSLGSDDIVSSANEEKDMETTGGSVDAANATQYSAIFSIAGPIILGDFWHNLIDGETYV
jgi:hypothetical protein